MIWTALGGVAAVAWLVVLVLPWQPHRTRERIAAADGPADLSMVTVLIPARDEAENIASTLAALTRQGSGLHAIVIDDRSGDATASIAGRWGGRGDKAVDALALEVLPGEPLPEGWGGKLWALQQGLERVSRPYTLLLDADIELAPNFIPALIATARQDAAALVSVMAKLSCKTPWERLLVPPFIFFFKLLYPFALVASTHSRVAAAAGGCILIETSVLREVGAFSKWADALIDDCTLARQVKRGRNGDRHRLRLFMSNDVISLRRYTRLGDFWNMVARTAYTQLKFSFLLLLVTTIVMLAVFVAPILAMFASDSALPAVAGGIALLAMIACYTPVARFYGLPMRWRITLPVAATLFLAMTWHSAINYYTGTRAVWKSRNYG